MRITVASAPRVTQPTFEKLKTQLATLDKKIATASKALQDHKDVMARSRYTPEGFKAASAKLKALEKDLAKLQTARKRLVAEMAVLRPFTYVAIVLKSDPGNVIIKKVLTGGIVPARPGDGTYSKPVPLTP